MIEHRQIKSAASAAAVAAVLLPLTLLPASAQGQTAPRAGTPAKPQAGAKAKAQAPAPGGGTATLLGTFGDWGAYTAQSGKSKLCYALSQPKSRQPANLANTPGYLFVSFRPAESVKNEVAVVMGFATKDGGAADLAIGNTTYALITKGANAWVKNPAEETQVVATMAKGSAMVVKATSARGNATTDRYSLTGFGQSLDRARKECP